MVVATRFRFSFSFAVVIFWIAHVYAIVQPGPFSTGVRALSKLIIPVQLLQLHWNDPGWRTFYACCSLADLGIEMDFQLGVWMFWVALQALHAQCQLSTTSVSMFTWGFMMVTWYNTNHLGTTTLLGYGIHLVAMTWQVWKARHPCAAGYGWFCFSDMLVVASLPQVVNHVVSRAAIGLLPVPVYWLALLSFSSHAQKTKSKV